MSLTSVIIPTYNGARYIGQAIDSVLAQSSGDYEIVVIDDGSTDDTPAILDTYGDRIIVIRQPNQKLPTARNNGVAASTGEYISFLDSDDLYLPRKLQIQARLLDEHTGVGLVAAASEIIDEQGRKIDEWNPWPEFTLLSLESILFGGLAPPSAVTIRRSWFDRVGGFDPQFFYTEDMDFWYRLALAGCKIAWLPEYVCQYRVHPQNKSRSLEPHFQYFRKAIDRAFADPRLPGKMRSRRAELDANLDLSEASQLVAGGWTDAARERIFRAVSINPRLKDDHGYGLAEIVAGLRSSFWSDGRFTDFVLMVMADEIPALSHTMAIVSTKKCFYNAYHKRRAVDIRRAWLGIACRDPRWLIDRGGWSILGQSFIGFKPAPRARE